MDMSLAICMGQTYKEGAKGQRNRQGLKVAGRQQYPGDLTREALANQVSLRVSSQPRAEAT